MTNQIRDAITTAADAGSDAVQLTALLTVVPPKLRWFDFLSSIFLVSRMSQRQNQGPTALKLSRAITAARAFDAALTDLTAHVSDPLLAATCERSASWPDRLEQSYDNAGEVVGEMRDAYALVVDYRARSILGRPLTDG